MAKQQAGVARPAATSAKGQTTGQTKDFLTPGKIPARGNKALRVEATKLVYYNDMRRREGDVFDLLKAEDFNESTMRWVDADTAERVTGAQAALDQVNNQEAARKRGGSRTADVIGADD